jgi:nitrogen-specific signal transduction histidine kinase
MNLPTQDQPETYFAAAGRADEESLQRFHNTIIQGQPVLVQAFEATPIPIIVLNAQRQIVYANSRFLGTVGAPNQESIRGKRPGETVGCIRSFEGPDGCGTSEACALCGAVNAIVECQKTGMMITNECRISVGSENNVCFDFEVVTSAFNLECGPVVICSLRDISAEKRRRILERAFFHDVLNTAGGLQGIAQIVAETGSEDSTDEEYRQILVELSESLVQEIRDHRTLLLAESGDLKPALDIVRIREFLQPVRVLCSRLDIAEGRNLILHDIPELAVETDIALMRRVLVNIIKNALEATPRGGTVSIACEDQGAAVTFFVNNPGVIPRDVCLQIFQRSFSTKGKSGRGIGTYSMKLLGEGYLHGRVGFTTTEDQGTTFSFAVPKEWRGGR